MYLSPKTVIVDFLRKHISDPRERISTSSNSFTATAAQTEFSLTPTTNYKLSHVESVTVDSTPKSKWEDYYIDPKNQKVIFYTAMTGGEAVEISFGEGTGVNTTNWIYPGKPNKKLNALSFPRINVKIISSVGVRQGSYKSPVEANIRFQIDIWCKEKQEDQIFTIDGDKYTGVDLAEYLSLKITEAFEDNEGDLFPALYGYDPVDMCKDIPFSDELQCHHKIVECMLKGLKIGRIS